MQKRGFTLAEILISVGIVGVIAAIMLPMVNKFKPDENKIKYLQTYNSLMEVMPAVVNNRLAFPIMNDGDDELAYYEKPLLNSKAPYKIDGKVWSGPAKFCRVLASGFNTVGNNFNCSDTYDRATEPAFKPSFETSNGVQFMVQTYNDQGVYTSDIYIDVNGSKGSNCLATSDACKEADRFKFIVSSDGAIEAADVLGQTYLETRTNWKLNRDGYKTGDLVSVVIPDPPPPPPPVPPPPRVPFSYINFKSFLTARISSAISSKQPSTLSLSK